MRSSYINSIMECTDVDESGSSGHPCASSEHDDVAVCPQASVTADRIACDYLASMSLKFRENKQVPAALCCETRHDISFMLSSSREMLHTTITENLPQKNASSDVMNAVHNILSTPQPYEVACNTLQSDHDLNKYVQSKFGYVKPVLYCVRDAGDNSRIKQADYIQYVPLVETGKKLLQNNDIFSSVLSGHQSSDGKLKDICDGSYCGNHALFGTDKQALQIILYYDDFCPVNPLGHRANKYKIAGFYLRLAMSNQNTDLSCILCILWICAFLNLLGLTDLVRSFNH